MPPPPPRRPTTRTTPSPSPSPLSSPPRSPKPSSSSSSQQHASNPPLRNSPRLGSTTRQSSVQSRRSGVTTSLGLGGQFFANLNDLTSNSSSSTPSPKLSSNATTVPNSPQPSTMNTTNHSRRSSLQFSSPQLQHSSIPPSSSSYLTSTPSLSTQTLPSNQTPSSTTTTSSTSSRRPSLQQQQQSTHLVSFLSGIEHHTRVRSPGTGRGVSRSLSRSQSRAGGGHRTTTTIGSGSRTRRGGGFGSDGSEIDTGNEDGSDEEEGGEDLRRSPRGGTGGFSSEDEYLDLKEEDEGVEEWSERPRMYDGINGQGGGGDQTGGGGGGFTGGGKRSRMNSTRSRASSIASRRSRRSSISRSSTYGGGGDQREEGSPHPLLHELVRENTTGGISGTSTVQTPGLFQPEVGTWEETFETYKPSVLTTPTTPRFFKSPGGGGYDDEEPFLDTSAPNSPAIPPPPHPPVVRRQRTYSTATSNSSIGQPDLSTVEVFEEGERIGVDVWLEGRGGWVRDCFAGRVEKDGKAPGNGLDGPKQLEVERRLGEGTYAIVYLVREILYEPDPTDDDILSPIDPFSSFDFDSPSNSNSTTTTRPRLHSWASDVYAQPEPTYGRYYALKCLCKKDLTDELIEVQRGEAVLHRALPKHENIVQLYGAYETDDWLFLVLEYVPGNDLFFWLLESQNSGTDHLYSRATSPAGEPFDQHHRRRRSFDFKINRIHDDYDSNDRDDEDEDEDDLDADEGALSRTVTADTPAHLLMDQTPPSPSLLSSAAAMSNSDSLLSRKRLRLISRMFSQMCDAVQACHDVGIAHRDIKPENFIVVDGKGDKRRLMLSDSSSESGDRSERGVDRGRVVVKITDWGLGTMEKMCEDFDCGSKPYMAYECRNNLRPTYDPRQADVWSLGLVLLNLLYHRNPWADPSLSDPDFSEYVDAPLEFLKERFEGIGDEVATFLADRVFCDILEVVDGREKKRVSAGEFGRWAMKLVVMMGEGAGGFGSNPINGHLNYRPSPLGTSASTVSPGDAGGGGLDFSPVPSMPISIGSPSLNSMPTTSSLLSQFAPSTIKASDGISTELPKVPEESEPSSLATARPPFITSPTQLSEDDSLPSPTFSSPNPTTQSIGPATTSPESLYSPLPSAAASPDRALFPQRPMHSPPSVSESRLPPPLTASAATTTAPPPLPWSASSPFAIPQASLSTPFAPIPAPSSTLSTSGITPSSKTLSPSLLSPPISMLTATRNNNNNNNDVDTVQTKLDQVRINDDGEEKEFDQAGLEKSENPSPTEEGDLKSGGEAETATDGGGKEDGGDKDKDGEKVRSKRRKRGARKEKRAAKQAAQGTVSPGGGGGGGDVLEELAAASQDLARELSAASSPQSSTFSKSSSRTRPSASSRSHGTQSTSALQTSLSTDSASTSTTTTKKSGGGMFGRLKTLVNEGNSDLEAFKRRVDERNASIGAKVDTYSAPAKMQGARRPGMGTPMSSRGSVGTASWGSNWSGIEGGDEAPRGRGGADKDDHWRSASSRRDRLNDRRQRPAGSPADFSSSVGSNSTRGTTTTNPLTNFDSSRNHTPLSSFSSVGSESMSLNASTMTSASTSTVRGGGGEVETWRNTPASPPRRPYSSSRPSRNASSTASTSTSTSRPKLKDAAIDTSDLGSPLPSPPLPIVSTPISSVTPPPTIAPPRPVPPTASPIPASPSITSPPTPGKTNKLAKMLNSISVFNRQQGANQQ